LRIRSAAALAAALLGAQGVSAADDLAQQQSLEELRNTVVNLLQTLVARGVLTREQAEELVKQAEDKAAADSAVQAAKNAAQEKEEKNAVRVPYVPQIVQDQIAKQVVETIEPEVSKQVVDRVTSKDALVSALPDWVQRMTWSGDIRLRNEGDYFASDNIRDIYLDYNQVNSAGGIAKAGLTAYLNTTKDQDRLRLRARFGFDTLLGSGWSAGMKVATGSTGEILATTNQTLGTYGEGYTATLDQAYLRWTGQTSTGQQIFTAYGGRFENPWVSTDLVWYNDLTFEGVISNYRLNLTSRDAARHELFLTLGALPLSSYSPFSSDGTTQQKWLLAGQLGADLFTDNGSRLRLAAAYYDYLHISGQRNAPFSTLDNWTAPAFVQKGNTLFDIANTTDPTVNLFALAANYRIIDLISLADLHLTPSYSLTLTLEALRNVGFNEAQVMANYGSYVQRRTNGYRADIGFGTVTASTFGSWRATIGYRYLERDAVLDAFNDEDFHLGGTDAKGYTIVGDFIINPHVWLRLKYMSANAIDGPPLGIDVLQFDVNARF
jgi:hypothetical protein